MTPQGCPPQAELSSLLWGQLPFAQVETLEQHIETCVNCQTAVLALDKSHDSVVDSLRGVESEGQALEPGCAEALSRIRRYAAEASAANISSGSVAVAAPAAEERGTIRDYRLLSKLGEGGMGAVYKAQHTKLRRNVAIKLLSKDHVKTPQAVARFEREMQAVGALDHENIVRAFDAGEDQGRHFLVMEYVKGGDVGELARTLGQLPIPEACEIIRQAAVGLQHAHESGLVHRDIKPSNLMLTESGVVKVLDLGLALLQHSDDQPVAELTSTGQVMGTVDYMAPEQGGDTHHVDIRVDIYSLGASLYRMLTGVAPFGDPRYDTLVKKLMALATKDPEPVQAKRPDVSDALAAVLKRMLAKSPADRFSTPAELAEALRPFAAGANLAALAARARGASGEQPLDSPSKLSNAASVHSGYDDTMPKLASLTGGFAGTRAFAPAEVTQAVPSATDQPAIKAQPAAQADRAPPRFRWPLVAAGGGGLAILLLGVVVLLWPTPKGTVRIEINDPAINVSFDEQGPVFKGIDKEHEIKVAVGDQKLHVKRGELEFETEKLVLKKGDIITLKVELVPGMVQVVMGDKIIGKGLLPDTVAAKTTDPVKLPPVATPVKPTQPAANPKPFALVREGKMFREFKALAGAVAEMKAGDILEINSSDGLPFDLEEGFSLPLVVRAGAGFRPRIIFSVGRRTVKGAATFEGCDLDMQRGDVYCMGPELSVVNCRVRGTSWPMETSKLMVKDSVLLISGGISTLRLKEASFDNCLIYSPHYVLQLNDSKETKVSLRNCTYYLESQGSGVVLWVDKESTANVEAVGNVFHAFSQAEMLHPVSWRKQVRWQGRDNLYSGNPWVVFDDKGTFVRTGTLDDWSQQWGKPEPGSKLVQQVSPLFVALTEAPLDKLRAVAEPILQAARSKYNLPTLGPDWSLIGAGDAYLKALETEGRKPAELRPEVPSGGTVVLLRGNDEVAGFRTLTDAAKQAVDGDIIELRSDGKFPGEQIDSTKVRFLTLRAGAGYQPTLQGVTCPGHDVWSLEGLALEGAFAATSVSPGPEGKFISPGGLHRVVNCTFVSPYASPIVRFLPRGKEPPAIINCRLMGLFYDGVKGFPLHIRNSFLYRCDTFGRKPDFGELVLDRCQFLSPEHRYAWRTSLTGSHQNFNRRHNDPVTARDCYFAPPAHLMWAIDYDVAKPPYAWRGQRNVFAPVFGYQTGVPGWETLELWKTFVLEEKDSAEEWPPLADPRLWKLVPGTPGAGEGPGGKDLGADVSRVATTAKGTEMAVAGVVSPPLAIPEPPPLVEWLKGRKVRTVAQDGSGEFKTIQSALDALKPGEVVKVLDKGPYKELLRPKAALPLDCGLVSEVFTEIEFPGGPDDWVTANGVSIGHLFRLNGPFRLHGFALSFPERADGMGLHVSDPDGFVLENCFIRMPPGEKLSKAIHLHSAKGTFARPAVVRECRFDGRLGIAAKDSELEVLVTRNYFASRVADPQLYAQPDGRFSKLIIRYNIFTRPGTCYLSLWNVGRTEAVDVSHNTFATSSAVVFHQTMPEKLRLSHNLFADGGGFVVPGTEFSRHKPGWEVSHNVCRKWSNSPSNALLDSPPTDRTAAVRFLSKEETDANYLRLSTDDPKNAELGHVGALPPGPAPKEGDWFTRLRERWPDTPR